LITAPGQESRPVGRNPVSAVKNRAGVPVPCSTPFACRAPFRSRGAPNLRPGAGPCAPFGP